MSLSDKEYRPSCTRETSVIFPARHDLSDASSGKKSPGALESSVVIKTQKEAKACLAQGQSEELAGRFEAAVQAYDNAITLLDSKMAATRSETVWDLAVAWMNRGNALQKQSGIAALEDSTRSYQQTIELLSEFKILEDGPCRTLGCAWMNKGSVLQKLGCCSEAIGAYDAAISVLADLPLKMDAHSQNMLAAAWMNRGSAALQLGNAFDIDAAQMAAKRALVIVGEKTLSDPAGLEIALKARCLLCETYGVGMRSDEANKALIAAEASDIAEAALGVLRNWAVKTGDLPHANLALWFFQYGSACYADFQPQFLAAFLRENLDAAAAPAYSPVAADFKLSALSAVATTRTRLHSFLFAEPASPEAERWLEALASLLELETELGGPTTGLSTSLPV